MLQMIHDYELALPKISPIIFEWIRFTFIQSNSLPWRNLKIEAVNFLRLPTQ